MKLNELTMNDKPVELKFTIARVERVEQAMGKSIASIFSTGQLTISEIKAMFGFGLKYEDGGWVSPQQGMEYAEKLLQETDYTNVSNIIAEAIQRDCPFFFRMD